MTNDQWQQAAHAGASCGRVSPPPVRWPRSRRAATLLLAALLLAGIGCNGGSDGVSSSRRMTASTGKFNQGYELGRRDAKWSLIDAHAGWLWLWMTEAEYRQGYEQGWRDGRAAVKLEKKQNEQQSRQPPSP